MKIRQFHLLAWLCVMSATTQAQNGSDQAAATPPPVSAPNATAPITRPTGTNVVTLYNSNLLGADANALFARLDTRRRGYLGPEDVASNRFLAQNFEKCDADSDGRLSAAEVSACMRNQR